MANIVICKAMLIGLVWLAGWLSVRLAACTRLACLCAYRLTSRPTHTYTVWSPVCLSIYPYAARPLDWF